MANGFGLDSSLQTRARADTTNPKHLEATQALRIAGKEALSRDVEDEERY